ncbi:hypothetical protein ACFC0M_00600 [Streptomyces sp. NPDC056149]|uniref:hypothetical protein n=1 Tax=Streptomyces sp. NPDC056149 TaxID=3345728 RepID=UPI0035D8BD78
MKAQRALPRTQKGSAQREKVRRRVGRLHRQVAVRHVAALHQVTKVLATRFSVAFVTEDGELTGSCLALTERESDLSLDISDLGVI